MNKVKRYIEACHICLKTKPKYMKNRPVYRRIPVDYAPMQDLLIDIKIMPQAFGGYHLLLVTMCDQTNFTIAVLKYCGSINIQSNLLIWSTKTDSV